ncbi:MAG: DUF4262 domain-containing protein [Hyphomonas sp.]
MALDPPLQPIADALQQNDWAHVYIRRKPDDPASPLLFTTTVGLQEHGLPELVVFGFDQEMADGLLQNTIAALKKAGGWNGGAQRLDGVLEGEQVELRPVHANHLNFVGSANILVRRETGRAPLEGMAQIFWAGDDGRFPWDPDSTDDFRDQPRLDLAEPKNGR